MKNFNVVFISLVLLLFSISCQNATDPNIQEETVNASINSGEVFQYQTGISDDEDGVSIVKQPNNYELSTIVRDSTTNWEAVYQYKAQNGFQGIDHVELKLSTGSNGASASKDVTLINLNITVH